MTRARRRPLTEDPLVVLHERLEWTEHRLRLTELALAERETLLRNLERMAREYLAGEDV